MAEGIIDNTRGDQRLDRFMTGQPGRTHSNRFDGDNRARSVIDQFVNAVFEPNERAICGKKAGALAEADRQRGEAEEQLVALADARARQLEFAAEVASRIESRLADVDQLSTRQILVSEEIRHIELALASKLPPGAVSGAVIPALRGDVVRVDAPAGDDTYVHGAIADDLANLYAAAAADGIALGGWGWRDPSMQIEVRRTNCGGSDWEIYKKPAALCNPPAARPGFSQHEAGLAVDFTYKGAVISHQYSPAFRWMEENAHRWGFYNLPGEPWHWSTTGH